MRAFTLDFSHLAAALLFVCSAGADDVSDTSKYGAMSPSSFGSSSSLSPAAVASSKVAKSSSTSSASGATYTNPIINGGADPWMTKSGDYYYLTYSNNVNVTLYRSKTLTNWDNAESKTLWTPPPDKPYSTDLWAPEIHNINGHWWVIFTADPSYDTPSPENTQYCTYDCPALYHRMFTLQSSGADIWTSTYTYKSQLNTYDSFAIDGTYFQNEGNLYHIYSCWFTPYESWPANLCISQMSNPHTVSSNFTQRTIISVPTEPWERTPYGRTSNVRLSSNEGPEQLTSPITGQQFIIYSAARSDNPNYCLGQLALRIGGDPMVASDWTKSNGCVFYQNKKEEATGVGHASFVQTIGGKQWFIVYHGMRDAYNGWSARSIRTQEFTWNKDGTPNFPRPGYGPYSLPIGE